MVNTVRGAGGDSIIAVKQMVAWKVSATALAIGRLYTCSYRISMVQLGMTVMYR